MDFNKFRDRMIKYYKKINKGTSIRLQEPSDELKMAIMIGIIVFMEMEELEQEEWDMRFDGLLDF